MATILSKNQLGVAYDVRLVDCITDEPFDTSDIDEQFIVFYKPNGIRFKKDAIITIDPDNPQGFIIQYINTSATPKFEESILDLIGKWEYSAEAKISNGDTFESQQKKVFWVV